MTHETTHLEQLTDQLPPTEQAGNVGHVALLERPDASAHEAPSAEWTSSQQAETEAVMHTQLDKIGKHLPEVAKEAGRITRGAAELIKTFQVQPEFFTDTNRSMVFTSLALKSAKAQEALQNGQGDSQGLEREKEFVAATTLLLTRKHSNAFPEQIAEHKAAMLEGKDEDYKHHMDDMEQPELSRELTEFIEKENLVADLEAKIGISGREPQFHVLSIGSYAGDPEGQRAGEYAQEYAEHFPAEPNGLTQQEVNDWLVGLEQRTYTFAQRVPGGELSGTSHGFASNFEGKSTNYHLYIPAAAAEMLMAEDKGITLGEQANGKINHIAGVIRHEYVHSQGAVAINDEDLGVSLEERRAEYFSGDTGAYYDVKAFFQQVQMLKGGPSAGEIFEEALPARNNPDLPGVYELLGKYYGVEAVAEIAAAQPNAYIEHTKSPQARRMLETLGGCEGVIVRMAQDLDSETAENLRSKLLEAVHDVRGMGYENGKLDPGADVYLNEEFGSMLRGLGVDLAELPYEPAKS